MALPKILSVDEFIEWQSHQFYKHEFYRGKVRRLIVADDGPQAMAGGTPRHNLMELNVATALKNRLRGTSCLVYSSSQLVKNVAWGEAFFPDATIICGPVETVSHGTQKAVANPTIVFEVLSPATEDEDRYHKLFAYQAMPTMQEVVLVQTRRPVVERYVRDESGWRFEATVGLAATARIFDLDVPMGEIYEDVEFDPEPED